MGTSNARSSARFFCRLFQARRPSSTDTRRGPPPCRAHRARWRPSGARTTRISSGLGFFSRQPTHCRWGMDLGMGDLPPFGLCLALRLDVDLIAGELRGQAGILPLLADGERELVVRHDDAAALARRRAGSRSSTSAGASAAAMNSSGTSLYLTMSIFSPPSSSTTLFDTAALRADARADRVDRPDLPHQTAIFVRLPASRAMDLISTVPSKISGTSSSNRRLTRPGCVRLIEHLRAARCCCAPRPRRP